MPYALVELEVSNVYPVGTTEQYTLLAHVIKQGYSDIKVANAARTAYLTLYPEVNAQNAQVLSYSL